MSVELTLSGNSLSLKQWKSLCEQWNEDFEDELYEQAEFQDDTNPRLYVSGSGSTRGFHLTLNKEAVEVSLPVMASYDDWRRSYSLLQRAVKAGGGSVSDDDGNGYSAEDLSDERAKRDVQNAMPFYIGSIRTAYKHDKGPLRLPTPYFYITVSEQDLELDPGDLVVKIAKSFNRYAKAFRPSFMFENAGRKGASWALIPSIFPKLDWLAIPNEEGSDNILRLPWPDLVQILGDQMEDVGKDRFFLPGRDDLGEEIVARLINAAQALDRGGEESPSHDDIMRSVLVSAPLVVCMMVAASDGTIDKKELKAAVKSMTDFVQNTNCESVRSIFGNCLAALRQISESLSSKNLATLLVKIPEAMDSQLTAEDKSIFIDALVNLMKDTAAASGGFLGFGNRVSKEERQAISKIENLLRSSNDKN